MDRLKDLFKRINRKSNPDFWAEVELPDVAKILDSLSDPEWEAFGNMLNEFNEQGLLNLAEACGFSGHPSTVPMLISLLKCPYPQVGAESAIRLIEKDYVWDPNVSILADLKRHRENLDGYELKVVNRLISRLPS